MGFLIQGPKIWGGRETKRETRIETHWNETQGHVRVTESKRNIGRETTRHGTQRWPRRNERTVLKMSAFELFQALGRAWTGRKFKRAHFELFAAWKLQNECFWTFPGSGKDRAKVQTRAFWAFRGLKNSEMSAFELFQARGRLRQGESSNARILSFSRPENSKMSAFELFQARGRLIDRAKVQPRAFWAFRGLKTPKWARLNFSRLGEGLDRAKVQTRAFWAFHGLKTPKWARLNFSRLGEGL